MAAQNSFDFIPHEAGKPLTHLRSHDASKTAERDFFS
jgi:hypothetical protein